mgnify:CR=1 FL=1
MSVKVVVFSLLIKIVDLDTVQFHIAIKKEYSLNKEQFSDLVQFRKTMKIIMG